jgi:lipoprotein signal peptidase
MLRCALALAATAAAFAAVDLAHKAGAEASVLHPRSGGYVALVLALSLGWAAAITLTRSLALALAGGVVLGGALGNVTSLAFWPGVPNPIEVDWLAFNLADVFVAGGFAAVAGTTLALVLGDRERLRRPVPLR